MKIKQNFNIYLAVGDAIQVSKCPDCPFYRHGRPGHGEELRQSPPWKPQCFHPKNESMKTMEVDTPEACPLRAASTVIRFADLGKLVG